MLPSAAGRANPRRLRFLIGGAVIMLAIAYLVVTNLQATMAYYLTIPELRARGEAAYNERIRVAGLVAPGSIERDSRTLGLRFTMTDRGDSVPVVYRGIVPDIFGDDAEVVIEGRYRPEGVFEAQTLLAKCPSKFESAVDGPARVGGS